MSQRVKNVAAQVSATAASIYLQFEKCTVWIPVRRHHRPMIVSKKSQKRVSPSRGGLKCTKSCEVVFMDGNLLETALCLSRKCKAPIRTRGYKIQSNFSPVMATESRSS